MSNKLKVMENTNKKNTQDEGGKENTGDKEVREIFNVTVKFMQPNSGIIRVPARDEEHAKELVAEMMKDYDGSEVVDVHNINTIKLPEELKEALFNEQEEDPNRDNDVIDLEAKEIKVH